MKNKNKQKIPAGHPLHLHIERLLRHQYIVTGVIALMVVGVLRADIKMMSVMRDAYIHGFGSLGQHLREETSRTAETVSIGLRMNSISGE